MPLRNIMKLIKTVEWRNKHPTFDVDKEILDWAKLHAKFFLERWKEGTQSHWTSNEERNNYIGLLGQKCFELSLQQMEIPYVPNDPVYDWRKTKDYDFRIPFIGKIEVKTVDWQSNQQRLLIKCREWHDNGYVFAIKLVDQEPTKAKFMGYATNAEVLGKFTHAENEFPCPNDPCYWEFLINLKSASEFFNMLKERTSQCWQSK